jgi:hypothetical protein
VVVEQLLRDEGTTSKKVLAVGDLLLQSCEREVRWSGEPHASPLVDADNWTAGVRILDLGHDPTHPKEIGFFANAGKGTHRMTCPSLPLLFDTGSDDGFTDQFLRIVDLSRPLSSCPTRHPANRPPRPTMSPSAPAGLSTSPTAWAAGWTSWNRPDTRAPGPPKRRRGPSPRFTGRSCFQGEH